MGFVRRAFLIVSDYFEDFDSQRNNHLSSFWDIAWFNAQKRLQKAKLGQQFSKTYRNLLSALLPYVCFAASICSPSPYAAGRFQKFFWPLTCMRTYVWRVDMTTQCKSVTTTAYWCFTFPVTLSLSFCTSFGKQWLALTFQHCRNYRIRRCVI